MKNQTLSAAGFVTALASLMLLGLVLIGLSSLLAPAMAQSAAVLPQDDGYKHQGVASCASSFCHGALTEKDTYTVLQNEFVTWTRLDSHSQAYKTLLTDESKRIARNLGLPNAHEAKICLDCHADNVPAGQRGVMFDITDGVGCEACHGGAEKWLGTHITGSVTHQDNIADGLYPSEDPKARSELCLSCHYGTKDKFATHEIMGAGHPRLTFELDTFGALQPAHYKIDADYRERKLDISHTQTWVTGLLTSAGKTLDTIGSSRLKGNSGLFPELALFDCHSCHHNMDNKRYASRPQTRGIKSGSVRLNDSTLVMLRAILEPVSPAESKKILQQTQALHKASTRSMSAMAQAQSALDASLDRVVQRFAGKAFSENEKRAMLKAVVKLGKQGELRDYVAAEQAVMAIDLLLLDLGERDAKKSKLDALYAAVNNENSYNPNRLIQALRAF